MKVNQQLIITYMCIGIHSILLNIKNNNNQIQIPEATLSIHDDSDNDCENKNQSSKSPLPLGKLIKKSTSIDINNNYIDEKYDLQV